MGNIERRFEPHRSLLDDPERLLKLYGISVNERVKVVDEVESLRQQLRGAVRENERLRAALKQCQNTDDAEVYRWAGNALAGLHWTGASPGEQQ